MKTVNKCQIGCMTFHGNETRHIKECIYYPESLSKYRDDLEKQLSKYKQAFEVLRESNKYYAQIDNYSKRDDSEMIDVIALDGMAINEQVRASGKRAREAEKKVNEIMEGE